MKQRIDLKILFTLFSLVCLPGNAAAILDQFVGDSAIYSGSTQYLRPNVLLAIDNSAGMEQAGSQDPYDPTETYSGSFLASRVYERKTATGGVINYVQYISDISLVSCTEARTALLSNGFYAGFLKKSDGSCDTPQAGNYFLGNILNYLNQTTPAWTASTTYSVGDKIEVTVGGADYTYECIVAGTSGSSAPTWPTTVIPLTTEVVDNTVTWKAGGSILNMVQATLSQVISGARKSVNFGVMTFGSNNNGGAIRQPILKVSETDTNGPANYNSLLSTIDGLTLLNANAQPVNELFWDAGLYFQGLNDSSNKISSESTPYPSPMDYSCQKNFLVVLSTGSADSDAQTKDRIGDLNGDGNEGFVDDGAKYLYETDVNLTFDGVQRVQTHVIQLLTPKVQRLEDATNASHGRGSYIRVNNATELTEALLNAMANIVLESDTSFVAPVVPTSPENRTYSGERVYLGFFKPISQKPWRGNLKKYGINYQNQIIDKNGNIATLADGSFNDLATSFWSLGSDAGAVEEGGAGEKLLLRNFTTDPRMIYSNLTADTDLTATANRFDTTNISPADLGYDASETNKRDKLVHYIYGYDAYDEDGDGTEGNPVNKEKREWLFGDILHSRPQIVNFNTYSFTEANESNPLVNKTVIFVGTNDGMLHAIRDADGKELWGFIPDELIPNLKELGKRPAKHTYFIDASPQVYIYDNDHDGNIGPVPETMTGDTDATSIADNGTNDKVILIFGLRRGGNAYYALDVTDPESPKFLWKITPSTTGFSHLGETWSEPVIEKVKIGTSEKMVAFVGGGYDREEDGRYGGIYKFPIPNIPNTAEGRVTSSGNISPWPSTMRPNARGRAVYAFEIATLDSTTGIPTVPTSPNRIWEYTYSTTFPSPNFFLNYAFPANLAVLDTDYNGYVDRIYSGDLGGRMWRFEVGDINVANWSGDIIFWGHNFLNPLHKILYKPSIVYESGYDLIAFGTGDREHPLNVPVDSAPYHDRMAVLKDKGQSYMNLIGFGNMVDVTEDLLQDESTSLADRNAILTNLNASYGWYVRLTRLNDDNDLAGEKILASPLIFNKVAYYTSYTPNATASTDPCSPGNLGISRLYALDYKTGEAVLNFYASNDLDDTSSLTNARAIDEDGNVLRKDDRSVTLGIGIPSGLVVVMPPSGDAKLLIGCGGGLCAEDPKVGGTIIPIYWMNW